MKERLPADEIGGFRLNVVHHADCLDALRQLPAESLDAIVTDPPYGLGFMGKDWDAPGGCGLLTEREP